VAALPVSRNDSVVSRQYDSGPEERGPTSGAAGPGTRFPLEMLDQMLLVLTPCDAAMPDTGSVRQWSGPLKMVTVKDHDGIPVLPAFTSETELLRWRPEGSGYVSVFVADLLATFVRTDLARIVVDNSSERAFAIDRGDAQALLVAAPKDRQRPPLLQIGDLDADVVGPLVARLRVICATLPDIAEAYLYSGRVIAPAAEAAGEESGPLPLVLLLRYEEGVAGERVAADVETLLDRVRSAAKHQPGGFPSFRVDVMRGEDKLLAAARRKGAAIVAPTRNTTAIDLTGEVKAAVGQPSASRLPPERIVDAVRAVCQADGGVIDAYLYQMALLDRDDGPQLVFGLRLDGPPSPEREEALVRAVSAAVTPTGDLGINIAILDEQSAHERRKQAPPIYQRA
jgi:hypothetical protein